MNKTAFAIVALTLAAGCGGGSSSSPASGGGHAMTSGTYNYDVTSAPTNTCWGPSKGVPTIPMLLAMDGAVSGDQVTFTTSGGTGGVNVPVVLTKNGDSIGGTTKTDADLNSQGLNCILHIKAVTTGTFTADNAFNAKNVIDVSDNGVGDSCGLLIGSSVNPPQFDTLPCQLVIQGTVAKQ